MPHRTRALVALSSLVVLAASAACSVPPASGERGERAGDVQQPVINGTAADPASSSVVAIFTSITPRKPCSGVLLTNDWILTAKHCFGAADYKSPWMTSYVTLGDQVSVTALVVPHPSLDAVLLLTLTPFAMNGSTLGYLQILDETPPTALAGQNVDCWGYGQATYPAISGNGDLRTATLPVTSGASTSFQVSANSSGQWLWHGDSGGPCFLGGILEGIVASGYPNGPTNITDAFSLIDLLAQKVPEFGFDLSSVEPGIDPATGEDMCAAAQASCDADDPAGFYTNATQCAVLYGTVPDCELPIPDTCGPRQHFCPAFEVNGQCQPGYCLSSVARCMSGPPCDAP